MYLHTGGIISETDSPWCYSCCMLLKFYWHKTGLTNSKTRSSNSFYKSWAALLCYPPIQSIKYVWIRQFLLSHRVENILLTPASIKIWNVSWTKVEHEVTHSWVCKKKTVKQCLWKRGNLAFLLLLKWMAKSNSSKVIRKNIYTTENKSILH